MAFNKQKDRTFIITILTILHTLVLVRTTTNIDCKGKAFHCVNSTHFKICVDFGGVSKTVDDFLIACPPSTVCSDSNYFECEYQIPTISDPVTVQSDVTNELSEITVSSPWELLDITTVRPIANNQKSEDLSNNSAIILEIISKAIPSSDIFIYTSVNNVPYEVTTKSENTQHTTTISDLEIRDKNILNSDPKVNESIKVSKTSARSNDINVKKSPTSILPEVITTENYLTAESTDLFNTISTSSSNIDDTEYTSNKFFTIAITDSFDKYKLWAEETPESYAGVGSNTSTDVQKPTITALPNTKNRDNELYNSSSVKEYDTGLNRSITKVADENYSAIQNDTSVTLLGFKVTSPTYDNDIEDNAITTLESPLKTDDVFGLPAAEFTDTTTQRALTTFLNNVLNLNLETTEVIISTKKIEDNFTATSNSYLANNKQLSTFEEENVIKKSATNTNENYEIMKKGTQDSTDDNTQKDRIQKPRLNEVSPSSQTVKSLLTGFQHTTTVVESSENKYFPTLSTTVPYAENIIMSSNMTDTLPTDSYTGSTQKEPATNELLEISVSPWELLNITTFHLLNNNENTEDLLHKNTIQPDILLNKAEDTSSAVTDIYNSVNDVPSELTTKNYNTVYTTTISDLEAKEINNLMYLDSILNKTLPQISSKSNVTSNDKPRTNILLEALNINTEDLLHKNTIQPDILLNKAEDTSSAATDINNSVNDVPSEVTTKSYNTVYKTTISDLEVKENNNLMYLDSILNKTTLLPQISRKSNDTSDDNILLEALNIQNYLTTESTDLFQSMNISVSDTDYTISASTIKPSLFDFLENSSNSSLNNETNEFSLLLSADFPFAENMPTSPDIIDSLYNTDLYVGNMEQQSIALDLDQTTQTNVFYTKSLNTKVNLINTATKSYEPRKRNYPTTETVVDIFSFVTNGTHNENEWNTTKTEVTSPTLTTVTDYFTNEMNHPLSVHDLVDGSQPVNLPFKYDDKLQPMTTDDVALQDSKEKISIKAVNHTSENKIKIINKNFYNKQEITTISDLDFTTDSNPNEENFSIASVINKSEFQRGVTNKSSSNITLQYLGNKYDSLPDQTDNVDIGFTTALNIPLNNNVAEYALQINNTNELLISKTELTTVSSTTTQTEGISKLYSITTENFNGSTQNIAMPKFAHDIYDQITKLNTNLSETKTLNNNVQKSITTASANKILNNSITKEYFRNISSTNKYPSSNNRSYALQNHTGSLLKLFNSTSISNNSYLSDKPTTNFINGNYTKTSPLKTRYSTTDSGQNHTTLKPTFEPKIFSIEITSKKFQNKLNIANADNDNIVTTYLKQINETEVFKNVTEEGNANTKNENQSLSTQGVEKNHNDLSNDTYNAGFISDVITTTLANNMTKNYTNELIKGTFLNAQTENSTTYNAAQDFKDLQSTIYNYNNIDESTKRKGIILTKPFKTDMDYNNSKTILSLLLPKPFLLVDSITLTPINSVKPKTNQLNESYFNNYNTTLLSNQNQNIIKDDFTKVTNNNKSIQNALKPNQTRRMKHMPKEPINKSNFRITLNIDYMDDVSNSTIYHNSTPSKHGESKSKHFTKVAPVHINNSVAHDYDRAKSKFLCKSRGKYSDKKDCQNFYICIGRNEPIFGKCPNNTVFSEISKQCTKNLSHCIRNNQFQCTSPGRYVDIFSEQFYYICVKRAVGYVRFKLQCQKGYHLDKSKLKCSLDSLNESMSKEDSSKTESEKYTIESKSKEDKESKNSNKDFGCKKEGKFEYPDDCRKYYQCTKNGKSEFRRKIKKCDSDEVYNKEKRKCVDDESYECTD